LEAIVTINVNHPYQNSPYDVLTVPDDPELNLPLLDATIREIQLRFQKLVRWWTTHPSVTPRRSQDELAKALSKTGFPGRVQIDAFLCTTLDKAGDFDGLVKQQEKLPLKLYAPVINDWDTGMEPWKASPVGKITLDEVVVSHQHNYDDPQMDLYEVRFDS
jgi:hypothetical protein